MGGFWVRGPHFGESLKKKSLVVSVVSFLYVSGIANPAEEIPGTPNNQCSMDVWSFQTTFPFVQVWFIIQLKREIKNWFFMVPGNKLLVEEVRIYMFFSSFGVRQVARIL